MYIAQLQLKGFKSFGGEHELLLSPGLTCIVGPNGSGKSNLLDAVRWVLGEGSPSELRISRQTDLLFQGSVSLSPCKEAEASVRLVSGKKGCRIRRKIDREGNGLLTIDGNRARLQDLDQIKRDWGLEGIRFAFIGQGEISEIIQQKPLQRRMLLEGLFGIDLYRRKREEAVDRLRKAEDELLRLLTLLSELSARRDEIAPMVEKARKAKEVLDLLEEQRRLYYWLRRERSEIALEALKTRREILVREQVRHSFWSAGWTRRKGLLQKELESLQKEMEDCRRRQASASSSLQETLRQAASLASSVRMNRDQVKTARAECLAKEEALQGLERDERAQRDLLKSLEAELSRKKAEAIALREDRLLRRQDWEKREKELRSLTRRRAELQAEEETQKARLAALGRQWASLEAERRGLQEELSRLETAGAEREAQVLSLVGSAELAVERHAEAFALSQRTATELSRLRKKESQVAQELESLNQKLDGQVFPKAVQFLVAASRLGRLAVSPVPVIEAFECPGRFEKAIESYLGARQFWLLVRDMEEAGVCIEKLRQSGAGRATFLPLERCRGAKPARDPGLTREPGVLGWALDLVVAEKDWKKAIEHLLGDLLVLENYRFASDLVRRRPRLAVATLDGEVFMPGGSISGGAQKTGSGGMEIRRKTKETEALLENLQAEIRRLEAELARAEAVEIEASEEKDRAFSERREAEEALRLLHARRDRTEREIRQLAEAEKKLKAGLSETGKCLLALILEKRQAEEKIGTLEQEKENFPPDEGPTGLETEVLLLEEKQRGTLELLKRMDKEVRGVRESLKTEEARIASRESVLEKLFEDLARLGQNYLALWRTKSGLEEMERTIAGRLEKDQKSLVRVVAREGRAGEASRRSLARLEELEREILEAGNGLAELMAEWEEKFPYPGPGRCGEIDLDEVKRSIRNAEKVLRAMGEVELGVLSEEESLLERTAFLSEQCADVREGIRSLQGFIAETDREASRVFGKAMDGIDRRFNALFQRLFGGGEAHLQIEGPQEGWEAGVDFTARPPGKRPQGLAQLSGGEQSLTAIALLFAAMEEARVPIAILDEADAALDEVNLRRYVDLASEYARELQILAMTHRRTTMEKADVLYGVTLSEPGLSQLVGVRMEDWT